MTLLSRDPGHFLRAHPEFQHHPWLEIVRGDVCDAASLPRGRAVTHVIHAAADTTLGPQLTPLARFDQIRAGTRNVLDLAAQSGARRMLFTSSGAVYGRQGYGEPSPQAGGEAPGIELCGIGGLRHAIGI